MSVQENLETGLTSEFLRDEFAAHAMGALIPSYLAGHYSDSEDPAMSLAEEAYEIADSMLIASGREPQ